jgi:hypothetical protein
MYWEKNKRPPLAAAGVVYTCGAQETLYIHILLVALGAANYFNITEGQ